MQEVAAEMAVGCAMADDGLYGGSPPEFLLPMRRGFLYLVVIIDWATRKVLVWREADFCAEALNEALIRFGPPDIMNTDQGKPGQSVHLMGLERPAGKAGVENLDG